MIKILAFAQKAIVEKRGKVLVLKNPSNTSFNPGMIHFPGGRMEFGEKVDEHVIREVFEETNIKIKPLEPIDVVSWTVKAGKDPRKSLKGKELQVVALVRRCRYISGKPSHAHDVDDEDIENVYWANPKQLVRNPNFDKKLLPALKKYLKFKRKNLS